LCAAALIAVYAWFESTETPTNGEWLPATLKGITDVGYRVHFKFAAESDITDLSPDRVRAEGTSRISFFFRS
jgi:hypothetical protein